jgi:DNA-binding transcriptional MerR regulator
MLIARFAKLTGLSRDTVRFYVKRGLLKPEVGRSGTNRYQSFDATDVDRALLIREAQALGWSLREIGRFGAEYERGDLSDARKIELLRERLDAVERQAAKLRAMRRYFQRKIAWLEAGARGDPPAFDGGTLRAASSLCALPGRAAPAREPKAGAAPRARGSARR